MHRTLTLLFPVYLLLAPSLRSQVETATLFGSVKDALGTPLRCAVLTLENQHTGRTLTSETGEAGLYRFDFITPGVYSLKSRAKGYSPDERTFTLHVGARLKIDFTLLRFYEMPGQVVEARKSKEALLEPSVSYVVNEEEIDRLPYRRREYQNLAVLAPGVRRGFVTPITVFDLDVLSISGRNGSDVIYYADGVDNNDFAAGLPVLEFPQESIQEFQVGAHRLGVEKGGSAGGFINVLTKSGTNRWKGSVFSYVKDENLMARDHFMREAGMSKPQLTTTQFGASIGGPITIDRTHLFVAYEGTRGEDEFQVVNTGGAFPDLEGAFSRPVREDMLLFKLTHSISNSRRLTLRYNQQNSLMEQLDTGGSMTLESSRWEDVDKYLVLLRYDWYRSPHLSAELGGYYGWFRRLSEATNANSSVLKFPSAFLGSNTFAPFEHTAQKIGLGGDFLFGCVGDGNRHSLKAGFHYQRVSSTFMSARLQNGIFNYMLDDLGAAPAFFIVSLGDSTTDMDRNIFSLYFEDDWVVTEKLRLLPGVRYDVETGILKDYSRAPAVRFIRENYEELRETLAANFPELRLNDRFRTLEPDIDNIAP
ncbi:MAG: TonB-dependent receptor domain-containing protein, partial [Candidatus Glassbacteria bacterium]